MRFLLICQTLFFFITSTMQSSGRMRFLDPLGPGGMSARSTGLVQDDGGEVNRAPLSLVEGTKLITRFGPLRRSLALPTHLEQGRCSESVTPFPIMAQYVCLTCVAAATTRHSAAHRAKTARQPRLLLDGAPNRAISRLFSSRCHCILVMAHAVGHRAGGPSASHP